MGYSVCKRVEGGNGGVVETKGGSDIYCDYDYIILSRFHTRFVQLLKACTESDMHRYVSGTEFVL